MKGLRTATRKYSIAAQSTDLRNGLREANTGQRRSFAEQSHRCRKRGLLGLPPGDPRPEGSR
jgi:hypothetical protein